MSKGLYLSVVCAYNGLMSNRRPTLDEFIAEFTNDDEDDGAPCCPDPECPGRRGRSCTFGGYADNH